MLNKQILSPTPFQKLSHNYGNVNLSIKRDDLTHPYIQGNKWRKLKYNLEEYRRGNYSRIISFGGVFSNHVYSMAALCKSEEIPCTLFLRAEKLDADNPTVQFLKSCNVDIELLDYTSYRNKSSQAFKNQLLDKYGNAYLIPEGGTNEQGVKGVEELAYEIIEQLEKNLPDYVCVSAGTGGTAAGLIRGFKELEIEVIVFSSLKGDFLRAEIEELSGTVKFLLNTDYHFGGYARFKSELIEFINDFRDTHKIPLDPVYTGKMMYGVSDLIKNGYFKKGSNILTLHTGGLQGIHGYNYMYASKYGSIETSS
jgi:1-aminocyclopropane-1-carboxylate deaminase